MDTIAEVVDEINEMVEPDTSAADQLVDRGTELMERLGEQVNARIEAA
jgi:hypothetical protein